MTDALFCPDCKHLVGEHRLYFCTVRKPVMASPSGVERFDLCDCANGKDELLAWHVVRAAMEVTK